MTFDCDFHMHTDASDGRAKVADMIAAAKERGLRQIAVTDHSFSSIICHQTAEKFEAQHAEIEAESDGSIKIFQGIEANLVGEDGAIDVPDDIIRRCDVLIAGFHRFVALAFKREARKFVLVNGFAPEWRRQKLKELNTAVFLSAIEKYPIDVIAHLGHRTPVDYGAICRACKDKDVYIELNEKHILDTKGIGEAMDDVIASGVRFIVGSDAHRANRVGKFDNVRTFIEKYGVPLERVYGIDGRMPTFKDKSEWKS